MNIQDLLIAECIKAKTVIGQLRPTDCLCNTTMVHFCNKCAADLMIGDLDAVIKKAKNAKTDK